MKQARIIQRLSNLLLATLLLFTTVSGQHVLLRQQASSGRNVTVEHRKDGKADDQSSKAQISATQFEAVVTPAIQLGDSGQTAFLLPAPTLLILLLLSVPLLRHFTLPHYFFSYFRQVFGHAIAPNAP